MKKLIVLSISFAFIVTFSLLFFFLNYFPHSSNEIKNNQFFSENFNNKNKIFLIGSSHVGYLNSTYIVKKILNFDTEFEVYNLAYDTDNPEIRSKSIEQIISLKPKIIFYGISYRDFETNIQEPFLLPDSKDFIEIFIKTDESKINPRLVTLKIIKNIFNYSNIIPDSGRKISFVNTPFTTLDIASTIIPNQNELLKEIPIIISQKNNVMIDLEGIKHVKFVEIVERLEKENISLVVFVTPLHTKYLETISENEKKNFNSIISNLKNNYNIKIYNFMNNYESQNIWLNLSHIAVNEKSIIYSDDIANMIISELNS